jgi:flagellar hook-associated protein 3 FlgL
MRITDQLIGNFIIRSNADLKAGIFDSVRKITSGRAVTRPSDDPVKAARILRIDRLIRDLDSIDRSHQRITSDLGIGEVSLAQVSSVVANVKVLAIQMANSAVSDAERQAAGTEVQGYRDQLIDLANRRQADGRYLFGGLAEGGPPYDAVSGAYLGSTSNRSVEIAPGVFSQATVTGDQSFGGAGNEIFLVFDQLITAMNANDAQGIADLLDPLDDKIEQTSQNMALMGTRLNGLNQTDGVTQSLRLQYLQDKGIYQDVDITAEITRYTAQENSLIAVVEVSRRLLANSLSAFLR